MNEPSSIQTCVATQWKWQGGEAPYTIQIQTVINTIGILLRFSNIQDENFTSTLNFPAGASISSFVSDSSGTVSGTQNITIQDTGDHGCYSLPSSSSSPTAQKAYGDLVSGELSSCQPVSILQQGSAPYSISLQTTGQEIGTYLNYTAIPQRFITTALPFASGTTYQILFQNSTDPSIIAGPGLLNVTSGGNTSCLLLGQPSTGASSQPTNSDNGSGSSRPNVGAIVGGAVGGTVVLLLLIGCVFLFLLRRRKSRPSPEPETSNSHLNPFSSAATTVPTSSTSNTNLNRNGNDPSPVSLMTEHGSSETPVPETRPIYHQDAGRVEVPPSYNEAGSERRAILELVSR